MIDITVVLDKSGSMSSIKDSTIKGYNTFLDKQREFKTKGNVTLVQFNSENYTKMDSETISKATELNSENYKPDGWTPLFDALGKTIKETGDRLRDSKEKPDKVVFVIITDGQENSSKEYKQKDIADMIEHQKTKYNWEFLYLGAKQDSFTEAGNIGLNYGQTMNFSSSNCMYLNVAKSVNRYSAGGDISFTEEERKLQADADSNYDKSL